MSVTTFVEGDIIRTEDPDFEMVYRQPNVADVPLPGICGVNNASDKYIVADGTAAQTKKIGVVTSFKDRETTPNSLGVLLRGYIVQKAVVALQPDEYVKPNATGAPTLADPGLATDEELIYGIVVGKANTNDQTTRVPALATELVIIKVGDFG